MQTPSCLSSSGPVRGPEQELDALIHDISALYREIPSSVKSALDDFRETVKHAVAVWLTVFTFSWFVHSPEVVLANGETPRVSNNILIVTKNRQLAELLRRIFGIENSRAVSDRENPKRVINKPVRRKVKCTCCFNDEEDEAEGCECVAQYGEFVYEERTVNEGFRDKNRFHVHNRIVDPHIQQYVFIAPPGMMVNFERENVAVDEKGAVISKEGCQPLHFRRVEFDAPKAIYVATQFWKLMEAFKADTTRGGIAILQRDLRELAR